MKTATFGIWTGFGDGAILAQLSSSVTEPQFTSSPSSISENVAKIVAVANNAAVKLDLTLLLMTLRLCFWKTGLSKPTVR